MTIRSLSRDVALLVCIAAPGQALAQVVHYLSVDKTKVYWQRSASQADLLPPRTPCQSTCPHAFSARVGGQGVASIPTPVLSGPVDAAGLGSFWNGGRLTYNPDGEWRLGTLSEGEWNSPTLADLEAKFAGGLYTLTVNGVGVPLNLAGDLYPNPPVFSLTGGAWSEGKYVVDATRPFTIATNVFDAYSAHPNNGVTAYGGSITGGPIQLGSQASSSLFFSYPANTLVNGHEYQVTAVFKAVANTSTALSGAFGHAAYLARTSVTIKTEAGPPPVFPMTVTANITATTATASAQIQYRPQDVGTLGSIFVFALAPATLVQGANTAGVLKVGFAKDDRKADTPIACVLAQMNAAGQLVAVTSANLAAYLTAVLTAQGASISILNGVPTSNVSGATFFVGYGSSATAMLNTGVNRAAFTVPGSLTCIPSAPQTGWWWNPLEDGRGFSIEKRGNNLFFAAFLYDISGRSNWYVSSGPVSLEGSLYNGELLSASGGQTLGGAYSRFPTLANAGPMTMTFNNESTGTIVWPGGTVPIQRFNIIPNGLTALPVAGVPESGWWWNEQESGRGFFMEWQGNTLDIAGYMYDDLGDPVWYLTVGEIGGTPSARSFSGNWWSYTGGQTLTGAWRQNARTNSNVAPVSITFSGPDTALMTLPNGRATTLKRHRF